MYLLRCRLVQFTRLEIAHTKATYIVYKRIRTVRIACAAIRLIFSDCKQYYKKCKKGVCIKIHLLVYDEDYYCVNLFIRNTVCINGYKCNG